MTRSKSSHVFCSGIKCPAKTLKENKGKQKIRASRDSLSLLSAGTALHGLATAVGCGHHGLDGLIQQHPVVEGKERIREGRALSSKVLSVCRNNSLKILHESR